LFNSPQHGGKSSCPTVVNARNGYRNQIHQPMVENGVVASHEHQLGSDYPIGHEQLPHVKTPYEVPVDVNQLQSRAQRIAAPLNETRKFLGGPDLLDDTRGGMAVWKEHTLKERGFGYLKRVVIMDEHVPTVSPYPHAGNLYTYVKIVIPQRRVAEILSMDKNLTYDPEKRWLRLRGTNLQTNIAQTALITLLIKDKVSKWQIDNYNLQRKYVAFVNKNMKGYRPGARKYCVSILKKMCY